MPPFFHEDPDTELGMIDRVNARNNQFNLARDRVNPELVARVVELSNNYSNSGMPPGVIMGLALQGISPGHPMAEQLAHDSAIMANESGEFNTYDAQENKGLLGTAKGMFESTGRFFLNRLKDVHGATVGAVLPDETGDALRSTVRGAFGIMDFAWNEAILRPARTLISAGVEGDLPPFMSGLTALGAISDVSEGGIRSLDDSGLGFDLPAVYEKYKNSGESALTMAIRNRVETGDFQMGSGFFIGDRALERSVDNQQLHLPNGEKITIGRAAASIFEDGTAPYNLASGIIDASVMIAADPANVALLRGANVAQARRTFKLPGSVQSMDDVKQYFGAYVKGTRPDVDPDVFVNRFLTQEAKGRKLVERLTDDSDAENIYELLGRHRNRKVAAQLAGNRDPENTVKILRQHLGTTIPERPRSMFSLHQRVKPRVVAGKSIQDMKIFDEIPGNKLNPIDPDETLEDYLQALKSANIPAHKRKELFNRYVMLPDGDIPRMSELFEDTLRAMGSQILETPSTLRAAGAAKLADIAGSTNIGDHLSHMFNTLKDDWDDATRVSQRNNPGFDPIKAVEGVVDGKLMPNFNDEFTLMQEILERGFQLPNFRTMRRETSKIAPLLNAKLIKPTIGVFEGYMKAWKVAQLLRIAWSMRVLPEEQARMAAVGLSSVFRHPGDWVGWVIAASDSDLANLARKIPGIKDHRVLFDQLEGLASVRASRASAWLGDVNERVFTGDYIRYMKPGMSATKTGDVVADENMYLGLMAKELKTLSSDDVTRNLARGNEFSYTNPRSSPSTTYGQDAVKEWFWHSKEGVLLRNRLAKIKGTKWGDALLDDTAAQSFKVNGNTPFRSSREVADYYIEGAYKKLRQRTGDNPELLDVVATGKVRDVGGEALNDVDITINNPDLAKEQMNALRPYLDSGPEYLVGPQMRQGALLERTNKRVDRWFDILMGARTTQLARAPAFQQFWWQRTDDVLTQVHPSLRAEIQEQATQAGVKLKNINATGTGEVKIHDMEQLDLVRKQFGIEQTRKLLYDLDRRGQWSDILRNMIPFGEAWKEVLGTWARVLRQRPQNIRRFQQVVESARGRDNDPSTGFFWTDPDTGQEMFSYPMVGRAMSGALQFGTGVPVSFDATGGVQNVNLVTGSLLPGVGPVTDLIVSEMIPDAPDFDWAREAVLPFGEASIDDTVGEWAQETTLPAWMKDALKAMTGDERDNRSYSNTRAAVMQSMINSGMYKPDEINQAFVDSAGPARTIMLVKSMARFVLPTGPNLEYQLEGDDGRMYKTQALAREFRQMAEELGSFDRAIPPFIEMFGIDPLLISQPRTRTVKERSFTNAGWEWERNNQDKKQLVEHTFGYFVPYDENDDEFRFESYKSALTEGASRPLTSEEQLKLYNSSLGMMQYRAMKDRLDNIQMEEEDRRKLLGNWRMTLRMRYPGFDTIADTLPSRPDKEILFEELRRGINDPVLGETEAGEGIRKYFEARDFMLQIADGTSLEGERDIHLRQILYQYGLNIVKNNPAFQNVWLEVLSREVSDVAQDETGPIIDPGAKYGDEQFGTLPELLGD